MNELEYGNVIAISGKYKGRVGYYDNDEDNNKAVVYFDTPFLTDFVLINKKHLINTDIEFLPKNKLKKKNKKLCESLGVF